MRDSVLSSISCGVILPFLNVVVKISLGRGNLELGPLVSEIVISVFTSVSSWECV